MVILFGIPARRYRACGMLHSARAVQDFVNKQPIVDRGVATLLHVYAQELFLSLFGQTEFVNRSCEIVGWIDDIHFRAAEVVMLEIRLEDAGRCSQPLFEPHPAVDKCGSGSDGLL